MFIKVAKVIFENTPLNLNLHSHCLAQAVDFFCCVGTLRSPKQRAVVQVRWFKPPVGWFRACLVKNFSSLNFRHSISITHHSSLITHHSSLITHFFTLFMGPTPVSRYSVVFFFFFFSFLFFSWVGVGFSFFSFFFLFLGCRSFFFFFSWG